MAYGLVLLIINRQCDSQWNVSIQEQMSAPNSGVDIAENFESATLFFSSVVGFARVTRVCTAMEVEIVKWVTNI